MTKALPPLHTSGHMAIAYEVFVSLCRREGITVVETPLVLQAFYLRMRGKRYIYLSSSRLSGYSWLGAAYHELGHHFLHSVQTADLCRLQEPSYIKDEKVREREANAFSRGAVVVLLHLAEMKGGE